MSVARVRLWGTTIGAVSWDAQRELGFFEYTPEFAPSGIEVAPLTMPLSREVYTFPELGRATFRGLPGLLADSLPDRFGNALIEAWLASQGRSPDSFDPVERLCYTGSRGMGALEFEPEIGDPPVASSRLDVTQLVRLASDALAQKKSFVASLADATAAAVRDLLHVGTSAGGARAKAVIAWNGVTGEVRSGQLDAPPGFTHWILKFDGVHGNRDKELDDPMGFGLIEFAYHRMAAAAGIQMAPCRILSENGRHHFMTQRFDRTADGGRLHMQSLGAMAHLDFNQAGAHSYEQAMKIMQRLDLPMASIEEQFRRMCFNILARNQDDHVKNIAFLMDKQGQWSLSPAFDVTYSFNPTGQWTAQHQMTMNAKRTGFDREDFEACAKTVGLKRGRFGEILDQVDKAVSQWSRLADEAGVGAETARAIGKAHRECR